MNKNVRIGSWITLNHFSIAEILADAGFDWLCVDMEHSVIDYYEMEQLIATIEAKHCTPYVRVGENNPRIIKRALDAGAVGIIVPMVNSKVDAEKAVNAVKYPPLGTRGVGLARAQKYGFGFEEYVQHINSTTKVIVQIEHIDGINNLVEILSVDGVDGSIIGPYDLSGSMGKPGKYDDSDVQAVCKQYEEISEETFSNIENSNPVLAAEIIDFATKTDQSFFTIPLGSSLPFYNSQNLILNTTNYQYEGKVLKEKLPKETIVEIAYIFLNTPYLWGGKSPFGIDCSGFTQMVYKLCGYKLLRDASQQATQGEVLSFIEESEPGDLAFFDNNEGVITHVGIIMNDNYIIHAHGKVRIDRIDHSGIFNVDTQKHSHKLRVIKKII